MARAVGFLASFVAVVAGCVALVRWLDTQGVPFGFIVVAVSLFAGALAVGRDRIAKRSASASRFRQEAALIRVAVAVAAAGWLAGALADSELVVLVGTLVASACVAGAVIFDLYEIDKASRKRCPDCCEEVKVAASVCRYCGYRWTDAKGRCPRRLASRDVPRRSVRSPFVSRRLGVNPLIPSQPRVWREPEPVSVRFVCPDCGGAHPNHECPTQAATTSGSTSARRLAGGH